MIFTTRKQKHNQFSHFLGGSDLIEKLKKDEFLNKSKSAVEALEDLETLFNYCALFNLSDKVKKKNKRIINKQNSYSKLFIYYKNVKLKKI